MTNRKKKLLLSTLIAGGLTAGDYPILLAQEVVKKVEASTPAASSPANPAAKPAEGAKPAEAAKPGEAAKPADDKARNIRFQFEGMPYIEVVQRFAQMADKPLVGDMKVEGTLSYSDSRAYTYEEALDAMNVILSLKELALVEQGRYLRLVPLKQVGQLPLKVFKGLDKTGQVRDGEVVTVVLPMKFLDGGETAAALTGMLSSSAGSIVPMGRGKGLVVTDKLENIKRIQALVTEMDTEGPAQRQMKTHTLLHASGAVVVDLINKTFGAATAPPRTVLNPQTKVFQVMPASPEDYVTAVFDEASRSLVLFGPPDRITLAEELISQFEQKSNGAGEVRIFQPRATKADDLARMVREAVPGVAAAGEVAASAAMKARVIIDAPTNRLIVTAPTTGQLAAIEQLIAKIDKGPDGETMGVSKEVVVTRVFRLETADPVNVGKVIGDSLVRVGVGGVVEPCVRVTTDALTRSVVVVGSPGDVMNAEQIVSQLDLKPTKIFTRQLHVVELKNTTVAASQEMIQKLADEKLSGPAFKEMGKALVMGDTEGNRLLVTATAEQMKEIQAIVSAIDVSPVRPVREVKVVELKWVKAADVIATAKELLGTDATADGGVQMIADADGRRVVVLAGPKMQERVAAILKQLDLEPGKAEAVAGEETRIFRLKVGTAADLSALVEKSMNREGARPRVKVLTDPSSNSLIVTGTRESVEAAGKLVEQLDVPRDQQPRELKVIELKSGEAAKLGPLVLQLHAEMVKDRLGATGVSGAKVTAEEKGNRLVVTGSKEEVAEIAALVTKLDAAPGVAATGTRVFKLKKANPIEVAMLISNSLTTIDASGRGLQRVMATGEISSNSVVVTGPTADLDAAAKIVEQIDGTVEARPRGIRTVKVKPGTATALAGAAASLWNNHSVGDKEAQQVLITTDGSGERLVIAGPESKLDAAEKLIQSLDARPEMKPRSVHGVEVAGGDAAAILSTVQQALTDQTIGSTDPAATLIVDAGSNGQRLLVLGTEEQAGMVRKILEKLAGGAEPKMGRVVKVADLGTAEEAARVQAIVEKLYADQLKARPAMGAADVQFIPEAGTGRVILSGREDHVKMVEELMGQMKGVAKGATDRQTRVYDPAGGQAVELAAMVKQIYAEKVKGRPGVKVEEMLILPDAAGARLVVDGPAAEVALVEGIIQQIDKAGPGPGTARVFKLKTARAEQLASVITAAIVKLDVYGRPTPRVSVASDAASNTLIISGEARDLAAAATIIEQLDAAPAADGGREMRIFQLKSRKAVELAEQIKPIYQDRMKGRAGGTAAADALVMGDAGANRLIVAAAADQMKMIEEVVSQLDTEMKESQGQTRVLLMKNNSAASVAAVVAQMFAAQIAATDESKRLTVAAAPDDRTLVLQAGTALLDRASELVASLDAAKDQGAPEVRTYRLGEAKAVEVAQSLTRLLGTGATTVTGPGRRPRVVDTGMKFEADATTNHLIVAGHAEDFPKVEAVIKQLQASVEVSRQVRTFKLINGDAEEVARVLENILEAESSETRRYRRWGYYGQQDNESGGKVKISAAPAVGAVVVQGSPEKLAAAEQIIKTLDEGQAGDKGGGRVIQTVKLKKAQAAALAEAVNAAMSAKAVPGVYGERNARVSVTAESNSNSLLVSGPTVEVGEAMKIIQQLDGESVGGGVDVRIYKLENGQAKPISRALDDLMDGILDQQAAAGGQRAKRPVIMADERTNSLIVSATGQQFMVMEQLLVNLDKGKEKSDKEVHYVFLEHADAEKAAEQVASMFEDRDKGDRPLVEGDTDSRTVTVIARKADMKAIENTLTQLDESAADHHVEVRMISTWRVPVDEMAKMLKSVYPQLARGKKVDFVEKLEDGVQQPAPPKDPTDPAKPGDKPATPGDGIKKEAKAPPRVVIAVDRVANVLLVSGPVREVERIDDLVFELSLEVSRAETEFRRYELKEADPVVVAQALSDLYAPRVAIPQGARGNPAAQQAAAAAAAQQAAGVKMRAVAETRTRSVIVRAEPEDFVMIESLIKQLDAAGQGSGLELRAVALKNTTPGKVLATVQQAVLQMKQIRPGDQLSVSADERTRSIILVGRASSIEQVELMVRKLDEPAAYGEAEVLIVELKKSSAVQLSGVLQNMLRPGLANTATPEALALQEQVKRLKIRNDKGEPVALDLTKPIKVLADRLGGSIIGGNRLILTSTPENLLAMKAVIEMLDQTPMIEGVAVEFVALKHADATSAAATLRSVFTQGLLLTAGAGGVKSQPAGEEGKALFAAFNVSPDLRTNSLILAGPPAGMALAKKVVADIDKEVNGLVTEVRLFKLKHASATKLAPVLLSVFAEATPVAGTEGVSTLVTRLRTVLERGGGNVSQVGKGRAALMIQAEEGTNVLVIAARADVMPLIEDVITTMDVPGAGALDSVRIYPLKHASAVDLLKVVQGLYTAAGSTNLRPEDRPTIVADGRTNVLVVAGSDKSQAVLMHLVAQLDTDVPANLKDIRVLPVENADAVSLATLLQRMIEARLAQATASGRSVEGLRVMVVGDPRTNSLLIGGGTEGYDLVAGLVKQLDKGGPGLSGSVRLVPLKHANAGTLATTLNNLFAARYSAAASADVARLKPVIVPDLRTNSLMVAAGLDDSKAVDDLVGRLDQKLGNPAVGLTVLPLKHNSAADVARMLNGVFAARLQSMTPANQEIQPQDRVDISADGLTNSLVISASGENLELIRGLLLKVDMEPTSSGGVVQVFGLIHADAQRAASMLMALVSQGLYRPGAVAGGASREALAVVVDSRTNSLIVSASPENMAVVKEVITRIDLKEYAVEGDIQVYPLKHASAARLALTLNQFFVSKRAGESTDGGPPRTLPVTVIADERTNALLVTGSKESFAAVERMIAKLDLKDVQQATEFRVLTLKQSSAGKLQGVLDKLFANRPARAGGAAPQPITVVADPWANSLIIGALPEDLPMVESLVQRLDSKQGEPGAQVQVIPLAKADARKVATTVQGLYREGSTTGPGAVVVNVDERLNALVISAGEADSARIAELVKKLDTEMVARVSEIRVVPLQNARAEQLATILTTALTTKPTDPTEQNPNSQTLLQFITRDQQGRELVASALKEGVLITPDRRTNSLVVSAPIDNMPLLQQLIVKLDTSSPQMARIKVFNLVNADSRQMADVLSALFRLQQAGGTDPNQRSVKYTLIKPNEVLGGKENGGPPQEVAATIGTDEQHALSVTVDVRTNSLLVGGTDHYVALASEIISQLDASPAQERKTQVYRMKNAQAKDVETALRSFLDQDRTRVAQVLGAEAVGTTQRLLDREVAIVAEQFSNSLLISASPRFFQQISKLIEDLDQPQAQVLIQVLLAEVTLDNTKEFGTEWKLKSMVSGAMVETGTDFGVKGDQATSGGFFTSITGGDLQFLLRAIEADGRLEVLSRPQVLAADNKVAMIDIGQRVPLVTASRVTEQGDTINTFDYEQVGVSLQVTPRIGADGFVRLEVAPKISSLSSSNVDVSPGVKIPIVNERKATTTVSVQNGHTIIIGGLISTIDDTREEKLPIVGDIPIIGHLFKNQSKKKTRSELLIILTPHVVSTVADSKRITEENLRNSRIQGELERDEMQRMLLEPLLPKDGIKPPAQPGPQPAKPEDKKPATPSEPGGLTSEQLLARQEAEDALLNKAAKP